MGKKKKVADCSTIIDLGGGRGEGGHSVLFLCFCMFEISSR